MVSKLNVVDWIALILVFIGAINWGLYAFGFDYELVHYVAFGTTIIPQIIYWLVGLAGLYMLYLVFVKKF
jgi:uncharacterized membrane protein YuzA (DUF378 family)